MAGDLHIASLIVHVQPVHQATLRQTITGHPALELHADEAGGKLIVVAEGSDRSDLVALIALLEAQQGVLGCKMVYHEMINENEIDQELIPLASDMSQA